jgi:thioredoxin-related protein
MTLSRPERSATTVSAPALLLLAALAIGACAGDPQAEPEATVASSAHHDEIAWFEGTVEEAFTLASSERRPLFLYWGAEWCPPCHYLKKKIFTTPEFIDKSREFITVYLDGDTERAQVLGERLDVKGYPTVIIFNADGGEVMRMPSSVPPQQYADLLDAAMAMRPVETLVSLATESGVEGLSGGEISLLAFYSWGQQADALEIDGPARLEVFRRLWQETGEDQAVERSRFLTLMLGEAIRLADDESAPPFDDAELASLDGEVRKLLEDESLRASNVFHVQYMSTETVELLHAQPSAERDALVAAWTEAARALEDDTSLSLDDRLSSAFPLVWLAKLDSEDTPPELVEHVQARVEWAGQEASDSGELQAVMSTMASLLEEVGLHDQAEELLAERMDDTLAPYYYMGWVAGLKKDAGKPEEALAWYRKAYDNARGRYSRFRWGSIYLRRALELAPTELDKIESESMEVLGELLTFDDAFAGGNQLRLSQLASAYEEWGGDEGARQSVVGHLRDYVYSACERYPDDSDDSQRRRCESFLAPDPDADQPA